MQEHVVIDAKKGTVAIGENAELGHGAKVDSGARITVTGSCPPTPSFCGTFIGFLAEVSEGATIEKDALLFGLARLGPGVTLPSGRKTLPGVNILTDAQATDPAFTAPMTEADREFIRFVVENNKINAQSYSDLATEDPTHVVGINYDPGTLVPPRSLPTLDGAQTRDPSFRNRIIGDVQLSDGWNALDHVMGSGISLRADEGKPLVVGRIARMGARVLFHTFPGTQIVLGNDGEFGSESIVHAGPFMNPTGAGSNFRLASWAVFFQSQAGDNVSIGPRSIVILSVLPDGTVIPAKKVVIVGVIVGHVDW